MRGIGALCAIAGLALTGSAHAAGDVGRGQEIVAVWCTGCHVDGGRGTDVAPPFAEIAERPGRSESWFIGWLTDPHPPMPQLSLSRQEIADIVAYLQSLQAR